MIIIQWHTDDNRNIRNAFESYDWYLAQIGGLYMEHVSAFNLLLSDTSALERAGFAITDAQIEELGEDIVSEDAFAEFFGVSILTMMGFKIRRNLNLIIGVDPVGFESPRPCRASIEGVQR